MKDCVRLDVVSGNSIKISEAMESARARKNKQKKVVSVGKGNALQKKFGDNWVATGNSISLSTKVDDIEVSVKVQKNEKTHEYSYNFNFNTSACAKNTSNDVHITKQNISDHLVSIVKSVADLGNKLSN